jgi:hypothetical protein
VLAATVRVPHVKTTACFGVKLSWVCRLYAMENATASCYAETLRSATPAIVRASIREACKEDK